MSELKRSLSKKMKESLGLLKSNSNSAGASSNEEPVATNDQVIHPVASTSSSVATASNIDFVCVTPLATKSSTISQKPSLSPIMAKPLSPVSKSVAISPCCLKTTSTPLTKKAMSKDTVDSPIAFALKPHSQTSAFPTSPVTSKNVSLNSTNVSASSMSPLSVVPTVSSTSTSLSKSCQSRPQITKSKTSTTSLPALLRNRSLRKLRLLNNNEDPPLSTPNSAAAFPTQQQPHQKFTSVSSPTVVTLQSIKSPVGSVAGNGLPPTALQLQPVTSGLNSSSMDVPISPIAATAAEAAAVVAQVIDNNNSNPVSNSNSRNNSDANIIVSANNSAAKISSNSKGNKQSFESNEINSAAPSESLSLDTSNLKLDLLPPNPLMSPVSEDQLSPILPSRLTSPTLEPESFFLNTHNETVRSLSLSNGLCDRHPNFSSTQTQYSNNYQFFNEHDELGLERSERDHDIDTQQTDDDFENSMSIQRSSCNNFTSRSRQNSLATSLSSSTNNLNNNNGNLNMKVPTMLSNTPIVASGITPQQSFFQQHRNTKTSTSSCSFSANNVSNNINTSSALTTATTTNNNDSENNEVLNIIYDDSLVNSTISSNTSMSTKSNANSGNVTTNSEALLGYFNDPILSNMINNNKDLINGNGMLSAGNHDMDEDTKYYELEEAFCDEIAFDILGKVEHIDEICDRSNAINVFGDEDYSLRMKNGYEW